MVLSLPSQLEHPSDLVRLSGGPLAGHRSTRWLIRKQLLSLDFVLECALACGDQKTASAAIPHEAVRLTL